MFIEETKLKRRAGSILLGIILLAVRPAAARLCGDDVNGQRVACGCGDTAVSNVTLGDDPVTAAACDSDGLIVRAPDATEGVTIDLNGKTLRGGKHGTGIWIVDGGPGGARIVSGAGRASIRGFSDGIVARGTRGLAFVEDVDVYAPSRDGMRIDGNGYELSSVSVSNAGRDGFSLDGYSYTCNSTVAYRSARFGYLLNGHDASIGRVQGGNVADQSGDDGFHLMGAGTNLSVCTANGNRKNGVSLHGATLQVTGCTARLNGVDGIAGQGGSLSFYANKAEENGRNGIRVVGFGMIDGGGNRARGNRGKGDRSPVQCEIGGIPCLP